MFMFASEQEQVARRELMAANRDLDAAIRGRDWSAGALREAGRQISRDAVIGLYGRVLLHHDRVVTPSGVFELVPGSEGECRDGSRDRRHAIAPTPLVRGPARAASSSSSRRHRAGTSSRASPPTSSRRGRSPLASRARPPPAPSRSIRRRVSCDLASRYGELDGPGSRVQIALAEVRALEARLREEDGGLPRRYRLRAEPPPLPEFAS